jgi:hypothetical protein
MHKLNFNFSTFFRNTSSPKKDGKNNRNIPAAFLFIVTLLVGVLSQRTGAAATYYVATSGNDVNPGTQTSPLRTVTKGLSVLRAGDTLYIRGGTYSEGIDSNSLSIPTGSSWSDAPRIAAYSGETVVVAGRMNLAAPSSLGQSEIRYLIFDGLKFTSSSTPVDMWGAAHHIRIQNCEIYGATGINSGMGMQPNNSNIAPSFIELIATKIYNNGTGGSSGLTGHGIYGATNNSIFDRIEVYNNGDHGIQLYSEYITPSDNTIKNSTFRDNGTGSGISGAPIVVYGNNNLVFNNIAIGGHDYGILTKGSNHKLYNNSVYNTPAEGILVVSSGTAVKNNIAYQTGGISGGTQSNNLTSNPGFVDAANKNFALQSSSPAINAGVLISEVTSDIVGSPRPQGGAYDIGAYEYSSTQASLPTPVSNLRIVP